MTAHPTVDNWSRHFARIVRMTRARIRERDERVDKGGKT